MRFSGRKVELIKKNGYNSLTSVILQTVKQVGLYSKKEYYPNQLSGGQQRRVAIARAFITDQEIVLADKPTGDLDEETEIEIIIFFDKINLEKNTTFHYCYP